MTTPSSPTETAEFKERWDSFVSWMNAVRAHWAEDGDAYRVQVEAEFFKLLNSPSVTENGLTVAHAVKVLQNSGCSVQATAFAFFIFTVYGAIWGNRGVIPMCRDEDTSLNGTFPKETLQ